MGPLPKQDWGPILALACLGALSVVAVLAFSVWFLFTHLSWNG